MGVDGNEDNLGGSCVMPNMTRCSHLLLIARCGVFHVPHQNCAGERIYVEIKPGCPFLLISPNDVEASPKNTRRTSQAWWGRPQVGDHTTRPMER